MAVQEEMLARGAPLCVAAAWTAAQSGASERMPSAGETTRRMVMRGLKEPHTHTHTRKKTLENRDCVIGVCHCSGGTSVLENGQGQRDALVPVNASPP